MEPSDSSGYALQASAYLDMPAQLRNEMADKRVSQNGFLPSAVRGRALGDIVESSHAGLGAGDSASLTIPASTSGNFRFTLTDNLNRTLFAKPDLAWYIGSVSATNQWPNSSYGMGNMPSMYFDDWGSTNNVNTVTHLVVRNNSGAEQLVIAVCRWRVIKNAAASFGQSQTSAS